MSDAFDEFKAVYPKRRGANPWTPAEKSFEKAIKRTDPKTIIDGARVYAAEQRELGNVNTPYVCQAVTWLNQQRWKDYQRKLSLTKALVWIAMDDPRWRQCAAQWFILKGVLPPHTPGLVGQGWRFPSEWLGEKKEAGGQTTQPTSARADLFQDSP